MAIIKKLNRIFDRITKLRFLVILAAIIIGGFLEMMSISLISPLITVLLDSSMIQTNPYIKWVYDFIGFTDVNAFLAFMAFMLALVYIFKGVYFIILNRVKFRFVARRQASLSERLMRKLMEFSYLYHTHKNIAEMQTIIRGDAKDLFIMINGILTLLTDLFMTFFIMVLLLITSPMITLCVIGLALICVLIYFKVFRIRIRTAGKMNRKSQIGMAKAVNQAFGGIKEVKVSHREKYFQKTFSHLSNEFVETMTQYRIMDSIPKVVVEVVFFGGAFAILGFFIMSGADISAMVPQLSLFVLAAFRLLPAISRQVNNINSILFHRASVDSVYKNLYEEKDIATEISSQTDTEVTDSGEDILIGNLSFKYPRSVNAVLENVSFSIPENNSVAFVGPTGAGKTTLADLILGVLTPDKGGVYFEGQSIHLHFKEWSKKVGYIPQHIYLLDESILENVAFGMDLKDVDEDKVWRALEQAQLKEFVESLPKGLRTVIGDRGVRLSGGQRQRVGIARAMYEDPPILVLDEATSSLDDETERAVMDAVMGFHGNKTIIIIAHRLSTIEHCDIVYRVEDKSVTRER
jgi:ABC-type multidrug transport system fused ATPase/permease subunit